MQEDRANLMVEVDAGVRGRSRLENLLWWNGCRQTRHYSDQSDSKNLL
jgi:hypothetical protein